MTRSRFIASPKGYPRCSLADNFSALDVQALRCCIGRSDAALSSRKSAHSFIDTRLNPLKRSRTYLGNDISRPHFNPLQNTDQRLRHRSPNLQRRKLITTRNQLPTRHNKCIHPSQQTRLRLPHNALHSPRGRLSRRDELFDVHLDDGQLACWAETVCEHFQLGGCFGDVGACEDQSACLAGVWEVELCRGDGGFGADA